jgi:hypothetical protein
VMLVLNRRGQWLEGGITILRLPLVRRIFLFWTLLLILTLLKRQSDGEICLVMIFRFVSNIFRIVRNGRVSMRGYNL